MKKIIIYTVCAILYLLQTNQVHAKDETEGVTETDKSEETTVRSNNAIAKLISAKNGRDEPRISVEKDNSSLSGYAVKLGPYFRSMFFYYAYIYARTPMQPHFRQFVVADSVCRLISNDSSISKRPAEFFLPRQIIRMIFTGVDNKCQPEGGKSDDPYSSPMLSTAYVNADENDKNYKGVSLPISFPFDLMVNILTSKDNYHEDTSYFMQVNFTIEALDSSTKSQGEKDDNCLNKKRTLWILWPICRVHKFFGSIFRLAK